MNSESIVAVEANGKRNLNSESSPQKGDTKSTIENNSNAKLMEPTWTHKELNEQLNQTNKMAIHS